MVGRGMRKAEGKEDCLILDFGGNVQRHGPIDAVQVREPGKSEPQEPPVRQCPECQTIISIGFTICPTCGFEFPRMGPGHDERPDSSRPILTTSNQFQRWTVHQMVCGLWTTKDQSKPATMRVYYACGYAEKISEWVCFDHPEGSFPRRKAEKWWKEHGGREPYPQTVDLALCRWECGEIKTPETLVVYTGGEFGEIKGKVFGTNPAREPGDEPPAESPPPPSNRVDVDYNDLPF
jgi:DNA repair protein RadD